MDRFVNALKLRASRLDLRSAQPRFGTVTSVNVDKALARVVLQPEGVLSGWLPILSSWTGSGWGMFCPPSLGDQVLVVAQEGLAEHGVIIGGAFSDSHKPPPVPVGELWLVHKSGSHLKLKNDGSITIKGDLHVDGEVFDRDGSLSGLRYTYNHHRHTGGGNGLTSYPSPQDPPQ